MKFEEKLIKLRKANAWSQEEFAEKLNVTRQTISKWELGQTTPDTDNLSKMAKIFGVSVNDLLDDNVKPIKNTTQKGDSKTLKIVILIIILVFVLLGIGAIVLNKIFNKVTNPDVPKSFTEIFNQVFDKINPVSDEAQSGSTGIGQSFFNSNFKDFYFGETSGSSTKDLLNEILKSNESNQKIITLKYENIETSNSQEIKNIYNKIDKDKLYDISYEYDEKGYINKAIITVKGLSPSAINSFNSTFKNLYYGGQSGFFVNICIDKIIQSNEEHPDNLISVSYNGTVTSDKNKLIKMKKSFSNSKTYDIYYEYDENGLINRANITK